MKMSRLYAELGLVLLLALAGLWIYSSGAAKGALTLRIKATQDSLTKVERDGMIVQNQRDSLRLELIHSSMQAAATRSRYAKAKATVVITGDTAVTKDSRQVLLPEVAERLRSAEAHVESLEIENAKLKFALKVDTLYIATLLERIRLQGNINKMVEDHTRCGQKCGMLIGSLLTVASVEVASKLHK